MVKESMFRISLGIDGNCCGDDGLISKVQCWIHGGKTSSFWALPRASLNPSRL